MNQTPQGGASRRAAEKVPVPQNAVTPTIRRRAVAVVVVMLLMFSAVIYNLVVLQIVETEKYRSMATNQQLSDEEITPARGNIYDANMKLLAQSATVWTVTASPRDMNKAGTDITLVANKLAEVLELDAADVLEKLSDTASNYKLIKYKIEKPLADEINSWIAEYNKDAAHKETQIAGITLLQDTKRYYPYGSFASTIIGFVNVDGDGLSGLEYYYNEELSGTPGRVVRAKNALGYDMPVGDYSAEYDPTQGHSLVLTVDETIQHAAEKYLLAAVEEHNADQGGVCVVMNVKTGAILAMTTMRRGGAYDLNDPYTVVDPVALEEIAAITDDEARKTARQKAQQAQWRNKAVADAYEPGSVFKVVTASAALDSGVATLNTSFTCTGSIQVGGWTMKCAHYPSAHGSQNFYQGLNNSCNPYYIQLGQSMGVHTFCQYVEGFGFGEKTGVDLPSESAGFVYTEAQMGITELSSCSFGQSTSVTPIQMLTAICAAVNGGYLMQPYIVSQVLDEESNIISTTQPTVKRQVVSEETSATICSLLEESVSTGSNQRAKVSGYHVGGKSGTSQKLTTDLELRLYVSSFAAFAPADDPEIAVLVMLDEPHSPSGSYYGGTLAGPVCSNILGEVLPYLGIDTQYTEEELAVLNLNVPSLLGNTPSAAQATLNGVGFNTKVVGSGTEVTYQFPAAGTKMPRQSTVILYTDAGATGTLVTVPDTAGKSMSVVKEMIKAVGLNIETTGMADGTNVQAVKQSINAGEQVELGTLVSVEFYDNTITD